MDRQKTMQIESICINIIFFSESYYLLFSNKKTLIKALRPLRPFLDYRLNSFNCVVRASYAFIYRSLSNPGTPVRGCVDAWVSVTRGARDRHNCALAIKFNEIKLCYFWTHLPWARGTEADYQFNVIWAGSVWLNNSGLLSVIDERCNDMCN